MRSLLDQLGSRRLGPPDKRYPSMLVAGTKGKGSTAAFVAECLRAAGYRVGRYTQPHLIDWRERTWVDGAIISQGDVVDLVNRIRPVVDGLHEELKSTGGLTMYEVGTAIALCYFADREVDFAVLEIGVGGALDALNAVEPVLSVVTSVSVDHTDVLGETLEEIAAQKAGIFRRGRSAVAAPQNPEVESVLRTAARDRGTELYFIGWEWRWTQNEGGSIDVAGPYGTIEGLRIALRGDHQRDNATVALAAVQLLDKLGIFVPESAIRRGLGEVEWPGRVQVIRENPTVVVDAAHNADSAARLLETIQRQFRYSRLILVFGASADKDIEGMARVLGSTADFVILTQSGHRRAARTADLISAFAPHRRTVESYPEAAFQRALAEAGPDDLVLIAGSVFLAGRAIQELGARP